MKMLKLTPENQLRRFYEDIERMNAGRKMDYSIGQHIELLIKRVSKLEASAMSAFGQDRETGLEAKPASAVPEADAQTPSPIT